MKTFKENLKTLMDYESITAKDITKYLNVSNRNMIVYNWLKGHSIPLLNNALKLADFFQVSLDYLFGRTLDFEKRNFKPAPPFDQQLRKILKDFKVSQYKLVKDKICNMNNFYKWFKLKVSPKMESLIKLADYLNISLDHLVGRE